MGIRSELAKCRRNPVPSSLIRPHRSRDHRFTIAIRRMPGSARIERAQSAWAMGRASRPTLGRHMLHRKIPANPPEMPAAIAQLTGWQAGSASVPLAHDPAKWNRFADKIMRQIYQLARVPQISLRNLRKLDCVRKTGTHPGSSPGQAFC
jgi:hypothetical protein